MPLARLRAIAGGVSGSAIVGADLNLPSFDTRVGSPAWAVVVPDAWRLGSAPAYSIDPRQGLQWSATKCRGLAIMESGQGLAGCAVATRQPGVADDGAAAVPRAGRVVGEGGVHPA